MKMELSNAGNNIQTQFRFFLNIVILDVVKMPVFSFFISVYYLFYISVISNYIMSLRFLQGDG